MNMTCLNTAIIFLIVVSEMQITREQIIVIPVGPSRNNIGMDQCLHSPEIWSILFHKISYVIYNGLHVANLIKNVL